tara:strand:+ start:1002 stop:1127 length:126 start_codon:yes stop_codon:yes gene_type:complete
MALTTIVNPFKADLDNDPKKFNLANKKRGSYHSNLDQQSTK